MKNGTNGLSDVVQRSWRRATIRSSLGWWPTRASRLVLGRRISLPRRAPPLPRTGRRDHRLPHRDRPAGARVFPCARSCASNPLPGNCERSPSSPTSSHRSACATASRARTAFYIKLSCAASKSSLRFWTIPALRPNDHLDRQPVTDPRPSPATDAGTHCQRRRRQASLKQTVRKSARIA